MDRKLLNPTSVLAACVVFSAVGVVGWKLADPGTGGNSPVAVDEVNGRSAERPTRNSRSVAADQAGQRMASIRLAGSPEARMRATVDLAYSLSPSEFAAWIDGGWFTLRGGAELTLFTKIVMERWQQEDEMGLLAWTLKNDGYSSALTNLAKKDPQRVIDFFREHPGGTREMTVLWELAKQNPDLVLARYKEIIDSGRFREVQGYTGQLLKNLAETSPEKLEAAMEGFPASVRLQAETALSLGRLKESFQREIRQLWERPDGWMIFQSNASSIEGIGEKFLGELANLPLSWRRGLASSPYQFVRSENARMWWDADLESAGFSAREILRIRSRALTTIGQKDPADAIRRMGELEMDDSQRKSMLSNLFGNMRDLDKARELLSQLGSDEDRAIANQMLDSRNSREDTESKPENATDWLAKAAGADPKQGGMDSYRMFSALRNWDAEKMAALTAGFRGLEPEKKMVVARMIASDIGNYGEASEQLAGDALVHLMENPAPKVDGQGQRDSLMSIAGAHVVRLSTRDPAAAVEWVNSLPAGETKTWTQRNLLGNWKQYDPKAAGAWEKSLPAADRAALDKLNKK